MEKRHLSQIEAQTLVREADSAREGYIQKYLNKDHRDSTFYNLIINAERVTLRMQVELILKVFSSSLV